MDEMGHPGKGEGGCGLWFVVELRGGVCVSCLCLWPGFWSSLLPSLGVSKVSVIGL